jgi:hypothetical protein
VTEGAKEQEGGVGEMRARVASWPAWTLPGSSLAVFVESLAVAF